MKIALTVVTPPESKRRRQSAFCCVKKEPIATEVRHAIYALLDQIDDGQEPDREYTVTISSSC